MRGTTEAINLVAQTYGRAHVGAGDEIVISAMEHHSNIVPWQMLCEEKGARLRVIPIDRRGRAAARRVRDAADRPRRGSSRSRMSRTRSAPSIRSRRIVELAHERGIPVLVDGAQAVAHMPVDVQALGCDFYAFSGHKVFGPTGIGVLYGKAPLLEAMPPYQGGGDMIRSVTFERTTVQRPAVQVRGGHAEHRRRVGLGAAHRLCAGRSASTRSRRTSTICSPTAPRRCSDITGLRMIGTARRKAGVLSFVLDGVHPHDIGTILDREGIAIRTGHHCCQPLMDAPRRPGHRARLARALQHARRDRRAGRQRFKRRKEVFA